MDHDTLWEMEKRFWLDGPDFYESSMAPGARMVFPSPVRILAGEQIVEALRQAPRWNSVDFQDETASCLGETVVLAYEATGRRNGEAPYVALCASTYVRDNEKWLLLAHQQTPDS
ncbi:DUF4440 domain-containing protein [Acidimangrovimonas sediminis]|uniref:DUF4440 domain-containing protein n=1 Tax=Acidimangrovimonas sediminis TaxID=2056283 RepID=UPI0011AFA171|nr:DUF4440 domain-containing protein [Acidimangrovimonas sediminis]